MVRLIVMYGKPLDAEAFEMHYREIHIPLAKKLAGLQRYTIGLKGTPVRGEPYHLIAELDWNDMASLQRAFQSAEGQATAKDVTEHLEQMCAGVRSMIVEVEEV